MYVNKNHSYKHNEQINKQNIDNSECFDVTFVNIHPEMTSQYMVLVDYIGIFLHFRILLTDDYICVYMKSYLHLKFDLTQSVHDKICIGMHRRSNFNFQNTFDRTVHSIYANILKNIYKKVKKIVGIG